MCWKRQQQRDDDYHLTVYSTTTTTTNNSISNYDAKVTTIIILIDNDIHIKSNVFNLLKLKFQNQQAGKLLWLERRESTDYDYIPIEFSKDLHFVTNFIKRMNEHEDQDYFRYNWYRNDYFDILSDELKMESNIELSTEIGKSCINAITTPKNSQIKRIIRILRESETKRIEIICKIADNVYGLRRFSSNNFQSLYPDIDKLLNNEELLLKCISLNYKVFKFISDKVQNLPQNPKYDLELITKCVTVNGLVLEFINSACSIFSDKQLIMKAFPSMKSGKPAVTISIFKKLSDDLKNDREIILKAIEYGIPVLKFINSNELKNDREIVLQCVRNYGMQLNYVSNHLKNDREIVREAVAKNCIALAFASDHLKNDREFIFEMVSQFKAPLCFASKFLMQHDRELILLDIKNYGVPLTEVSNELLFNREFILECVKINGLCLKYAPPHFKSDIEIVNEAVKQNPFIIQHLDITNMDCKNSLLNAVELMHIKYNSGFTSYCTVLGSVNDVDVAMKLIETIPQSIHFLNDNFRNNCQELTFKSTLLHNGYWMNHSEDAFQERIIHAYHSAKIDSKYSEINYYRNVNKSNLWKDLKWRKW